jgi:hypothetical protein
MWPSILFHPGGTPRSTNTPSPSFPAGVGDKKPADLPSHLCCTHGKSQAAPRPAQGLASAGVAVSHFRLRHSIPNAMMQP